MKSMRSAFIESCLWKSLRLKIGSEEQIPQRQEGRKVAIEMLSDDRMVDAMKLRTHQNPRGFAEANRTVQMNENGKRPEDQRSNDKHTGIASEDQPEWREDKDFDRTFEPVISVGSRSIHCRIGMVQRVHCPQPGNAMLKPMEGVIREVCCSQ